MGITLHIGYQVGKKNLTHYSDLQIFICPYSSRTYETPISKRQTIHAYLGQVLVTGEELEHLERGGRGGIGAELTHEAAGAGPVDPGEDGVEDGAEG